MTAKDESRQCKAITKKGTRCLTGIAKDGLCHVHHPEMLWAQQHPRRTKNGTDVTHLQRLDENQHGVDKSTVNHLPECHAITDDPNWDNCICDQLRACEQRVAAMRKDNGELWLDGYGTGFQDGHTFALNAAEAAVTEALKERMFMADCSPNTMRAPLLAIHALKEQQ